MKLKILVTGGEGFIGKRLISSLSRENSVATFSRRTEKDITNPSSFEGLEADCVIHLAGLHRKEDKNLMFKTNVEGTLNVLEFCRKTGAKLIFLSTGMVYGHCDKPASESDSLKPKTFYGLTKVLCEYLCRHYSEEHGVCTIILRASNAYGPDQQLGFLIPNIFDQIKDNKKIVLDNPYPKRDYIFIDDLVSAIIKSLNLSKSDVLNIGSGKSYSVQEVAQKITEKPIGFLSGEKKKDDILMDIRKAERTLDWKPTVAIEEGIKRVSDNHK